MKISTHKEAFFSLESLNHIIEKHLDDPNLNVENLLPKLGMSRTDLHRKLIGTVNMSATEYVRHVRLHQAKEFLLKQPEWSVYQIALEVGFVNEGYFHKRFKECFGCCPAAYRKRNKKIGTYV